jgi:alkylhydroperoxidase family enzyme
MARIPLVDPDSGDLSPDARTALEQFSGGFHPNVFRAVANHPRALEAFSALGKFIYFDSELTPSEREFAYLTASAINHCHY